MSQAHPTEGSFRGRIFDRLRLQFLAAGNWRAAIANSALPEEVQTTIREVVQQTGLLRFEKSEITTELIHHFQDGHELGHTFDELVRDFGHADVAVSLFRSSKLRSRPMSVKAFRGSMIVFGGGLIGYLLLQLFFHSAKPNPTVDYGAKLNEAVTSMPVEQQAWPLYRKSWLKHGLVDGSYFEELWFNESSVDAPEVLWTDHKTHRRLIRPTDQGWDRAVEKLESLADLLADFREGSKLPYVGAPVCVDMNQLSDDDLAVLFPDLTRESIEGGQSMDFSELDYIAPVSEEAGKLLSASAFNLSLPFVHQFQRAARILHVDTRYAMQQNDRDRAIDNVRTTIELGKQLGNSPVLACSRFGIGVQGIGLSVAEELVCEHLDRLTDDELKELQSVVDTAKFIDVFDAKFEKDIAFDFIQRMYSDDGNGDGRLTAVGAEVRYVVSQMGPRIEFNPPGWQEQSFVRKLSDPIQLFSAPSRREMEELVEEVHEELVRNLKTKMWEDTDFDAIEYLNEKDPHGFLGGVAMLSSVLKSRRETRIARKDAVLLAIACHRFKRANDKWPTSLDQLLGKWLKETPIDRLNGKPLHFTIKDAAPVIYSLGQDGDDDGGKALELSEPHWFDKTGDGDWILWPTNSH